MYKSFKYKTYTLIFYKLIFVCSTSKNNYNVMIDVHSIVLNLIFSFIENFGNNVLGNFRKCCISSANHQSHNIIL